MGSSPAKTTSGTADTWCATRRRPAQALVGGLCLVAVTVGLVGCSGDESTPGRSQSSFCDELHTGNDKMRSNYEGATEDTLGQLGVAFANVGEYTTMIHKLDDAAPAEIQTEMHDAREAWDEQADNAPARIDDIASALVKTLMTAMMSDASIKTVDRYALDHCGMQIFGTLIDTAAIEASASAAATNWSCEDAGWGAQRFTDPNLTYSDMADMLDQMSAASDYPDVVVAADALRIQVDALTVTPDTSVEALGQVQAAGGTEVADLYSAIETNCPDQAQLVRNDAETAESLGSVLEATTLRHADQLNGSCTVGADIIGFPDDSTLMALCDDEPNRGYALMDLTTGESTWLTNEDADGGLTNSFGNLNATVSGTSVAWVSVEHHKAEGLDPRSWTATLHIHDLATDTRSDVPLVAAGRGFGPGNDFGAGADRVGFFVMVPRSGLPGAKPPGGQVRHFDRAGNLMWQRDNDGDPYYYAIQPATSYTAAWGNPETELVDLRTGKTLAEFKDDGISEVDLDSCGFHAAVLGLFGGRQVWVDDTNAGTNVTGISSQFPYNDDQYRLTPAGQLELDNGVTLIGTDNKPLWSLGGNIAKDAWAFGNWVVVTNTSGAKVLVDPGTGTEATDVDSEVRDVVFKTWEGARAMVTDDGQTVWVENGNGNYAELPAPDVCGAVGPDLTQ